MKENLFERRYVLGAELGRGGMGVVHAATNVHSGQSVAIKRILVGASDPDHLAARLLREARALGRLKHANIVHLLDCGVTEDGEVYLVMELVRGEPLSRIIERATAANERLDLRYGLHVLAQVAEAIDYALCMDVVHRDLKPENIIVGDDAKAVVLDFGLARHGSVPVPVSPTSRPPVRTNPAALVGTPRYMAPEVIEGNRVDHRADVYSLGVILYEAASGHTPYDTHEDAFTTDHEILARHLFAEPRPLAELVPDCTERVWAIVRRCLAKDPADRYQSFGPLAVDLRAALLEITERQEAEEQRRFARPTEPLPIDFRPVEPVPSSRPRALVAHGAEVAEARSPAPPVAHSPYAPATADRNPGRPRDHAPARPSPGPSETSVTHSAGAPRTDAASPTVLRSGPLFVSPTLSNFRPSEARSRRRSPAAAALVGVLGAAALIAVLVVTRGPTPVGRPAASAPHVAATSLAPVLPATTPSMMPTAAPTMTPTAAPTTAPTTAPTAAPSTMLTAAPPTTSSASRASATAKSRLTPRPTATLAPSAPAALPAAPPVAPPPASSAPARRPIFEVEQ